MTLGLLFALFFVLIEAHNVSKLSIYRKDFWIEEDNTIWHAAVNSFLPNFLIALAIIDSEYVINLNLFVVLDIEVATNNENQDVGLKFS